MMSDAPAEFRDFLAYFAAHTSSPHTAAVPLTLARPNGTANVTDTFAIDNRTFVAPSESPVTAIWDGLVNDSALATNHSVPSAGVVPRIRSEIPIWLIPCYSVILLCAIVGNLLVISTLLQNRRMRTVTNLFLLNLAISDSLLGVLCMPVTLVGTLLRHFIFGEFLCKLIQFSQAASVAVSSWTLVAISCERYYAICHPLRSRRWQTINHAYKIIGFIWMGGILCMTPIAIFSHLMPTSRQGFRKCREQWPPAAEAYERSYNIFLDLVLLVLPLLILCAAYTRITCTLYAGMKSEEAALITDSIKAAGSHTDTTPKSQSVSNLNMSFRYQIQKDLGASVVRRAAVPEGGERGGGTSVGIVSNCGNNRDIGRHVVAISAAGKETLFVEDQQQHEQHEQHEQQRTQQADGQQSGMTSRKPHRHRHHRHRHHHCHHHHHHHHHPHPHHHQYDGVTQTDTAATGDSDNDNDSGEEVVDESGSGGDGSGRNGLTISACDDDGKQRCCRSTSIKSVTDKHFNNNSSPNGSADTASAPFAPPSSPDALSPLQPPRQQQQQRQRQRTLILRQTQSQQQQLRQRDLAKRRKSNSTPSLRNTQSTLRRSNIAKNFENKKRVVKMLFVLVLEFFICWTPLYVINTVALFIGPAIYEYIDYTSISFLQLLAYSSSCCNPITYCFMNSGFRRAFLDTFKGLKLNGSRLGRRRRKSPTNLSLAGNSLALGNSCTVVSANTILDSPRL